MKSQQSFRHATCNLSGCRHAETQVARSSSFNERAALKSRYNATIGYQSTQCVMLGSAPVRSLDR
eukprot:5287884-Pleurochrysis_carterae.AAC.2